MAESKWIRYTSESTGILTSDAVAKRFIHAIGDMANENTSDWVFSQLRQMVRTYNIIKTQVSVRQTPAGSTVTVRTSELAVHFEESGAGDSSGATLTVTCEGPDRTTSVKTHMECEYIEAADDGNHYE